MQVLRDRPQRNVSIYLFIYWVFIIRKIIYLSLNSSIIIFLIFSHRGVEAIPMLLELIKKENWVSSDCVVVIVEANVLYECASILKMSMFFPMFIRQIDFSYYCCCI